MSTSEHDRRYEQYLKQKALTLVSASKHSLSSSDDDDIGPSMFGIKTNTIDGVDGKRNGDVATTSKVESSSNGGKEPVTIGVGGTLQEFAVDAASSKKKPAVEPGVNDSSCKDTDEDWMDPITERDFKLSKLRDAIEKRQRSSLKRSRKYRPGRTVSCRRKRVVKSLPKGKRKDGKKNVRGKLLGQIIQRSPMCKNTWLVKFHSGESYYCHDKSLVLESDSSVEVTNTLLSSEEKAMMHKSRISIMAEDHDNLLKPLLFPLIAKVPPTHAISIASIVRKLKPTHPWLDEKSLRDYVSEVQKDLTNNRNEHGYSTKDKKSGNSRFSLHAPVPPRDYDSDSDFSSDLEKMFDECKNSSQLDASKDSNVKIAYCSTVPEDAKVTASLPRKRSASTKKLLDKRYGNDDSSACDSEQEPTSKRASYDMSEKELEKVEKYLSSAKRTLTFDNEECDDGSNSELQTKSEFVHNCLFILIHNFNFLPLNTQLLISFNVNTYDLFP